MLLAGCCSGVLILAGFSGKQGMHCGQRIDREIHGRVPWMAADMMDLKCAMDVSNDLF